MDAPNRAALSVRITALSARAGTLLPSFDVPALRATAAEFTAQMNDPSFWSDPAKAQKISQRAAQTEQQIKRLVQLQGASDLTELLEMAEEADLTEVETAVTELEQLAEQMETALLFTGEYDAQEAIIALKVGNGGQDAEDFCGMLLRMYIRWAERAGGSAEVLEQSHSDAGLRSATVMIQVENAYGRLRSEHGVHRLIRMSPFNAKGLRQTSFARVEVLPDLGDAPALQISPSDLRIDVFRSSGPGGQSVNTTDSAVRITYLPLNLTVSCQNEKSQLQNKEAAMRVLNSRLAQLKAEQQAEALNEIRGDVMEASFGSQIRTYTLQPYKLVKDHRTDCESSQPDKVFDGDIEAFSTAWLRHKT